MIRILHSWPGLILAVLLSVTALSGATLSFFPVFDAIQSPESEPGQTVAELAMRIQSVHPGTELITRTPSGLVSVWWFDNNQAGSAIIDPATGMNLATAGPDQKRQWLTRLHRSLFLGDAGRITVIVGALAMLIISVSGCVLVGRLPGGWRRWFSRRSGTQAGQLHRIIAQIAVPGLVLSSVTALWMSAGTFGIIATDMVYPAVAVKSVGGTHLALSEMDALRNIPVSELRELKFPSPGQIQAVFTVTTDKGVGYVDPATGIIQEWRSSGLWQQLSETIYTLHTGQGAAVVGLLLGLMAFGVPVLAVTGGLIWLRKLYHRYRVKEQTQANIADTIVLVGSENGSTWRFAETLSDALRKAGLLVHVTPMNRFSPVSYASVQRFLILTSTYGEGDAPASGRGFLDHLRRLPSPPEAPLAVLGFGDRSFPNFCAFAVDVERATRQIGWHQLLSLETIDRQSAQAFTRWGRVLGARLGFPLELSHQTVMPDIQRLNLLERRDFGNSQQVAGAILRFSLPKMTFSPHPLSQGFSQFEAGDLLGFLPEGADNPRFYSLASGIHDGFIEVVVRQHTGGLASGQLMAMQPGQTARCFLQHNPGFHFTQTVTPLILVGAGTGVGPLVGFIRSNKQRRPIYLFFGFRHPDIDFLFQEEFSLWQSEGKLSQLNIAVSRAAQPQHVQDVLYQEKELVLRLIHQGASIMVCGGQSMACGVNEVLTEILKPAGLTPAILKSEKRYAEDIY